MTHTKKAIKTLRKRFMKERPRAVEPTGFREKVLYRVTDQKTGCGEVTLTIIHFTEFSY